jgi:hypothetical protein
LLYAHKRIVAIKPLFRRFIVTLLVDVTREREKKDEKNKNLLHGRFKENNSTKIVVSLLRGVLRKKKLEKFFINYPRHETSLCSAISRMKNRKSQSKTID